MQSWRHRVCKDPKHSDLNHEIMKNIIPSAKRANERARREIYNVLYMDWLHGAYASKNIHLKQLAICWFLLSDDEYRKYVSSVFGCIRVRSFNSFMLKLESLTYRLNFGLKMIDGTRYELITDAEEDAGDWNYHCGHFAVELAHIANII